MLGLMGTPQQPIDFTMATDETVLDLRKIKAENNEYRSNQETSVIRSPSFQTPASPPLGCYPPPSYYQHNYHPLQTQQFHFHRESSEDGSERGSISPPSISSPTSVTAPYSITSSIISGNITRGGKPTRPFKAYPKDPLSLPVVSTGEALIGHRSNEAYAEFRRKMLSQVQAVTSTNSTNSKMKRSASPPQLSQQPSSCSDQDSKDAAYWERRRKNNEAAKRSRDARRAKEDEIAIRAAFLEQENFQLKYENATLRNEAAKLRCLLYDR